MKLWIQRTLAVTMGLAFAIPALSAVSSNGTRTTPMNYCQDYTTANSWAQGYGSEYANCSTARRNAESAATHFCYAAGHSDCELRYSQITYSNYNRCDAEASARASYKSQCRPERTFVRTAWAQHYGSELENCRIARRVAGDHARQECHRAGYRQCRIVNNHNLRVNGQQFCEVAAVAKGNY